MKNQLLPQVVHIPLSSVTYPAERTPKRLSMEYTSHVHELASRGSQKTTPNMKNQLLPQVVHIPLSSVTYPAERTPKRLSMEYTSHVHELASRGSQKTTPNKLERKSRIAETLTRKLSLGAKIVKVGRVESIFKYNFSLMEGEKLLKASQCFLSTTTGPIAGILLISTEKVSIPTEKMPRATESQNLKKPTRKYIEIVTQDNFEFWFMGFTNCHRTLKYLQQVITQTQ